MGDVGGKVGAEGSAERFSEEVLRATLVCSCFSRLV